MPYNDFIFVQIINNMRVENKIGIFYRMLIIFVAYVLISFVIITYYFVKMNPADVTSMCVSVYVVAVSSFLTVMLLMFNYVIKYRRMNNSDIIRSHYINNIIHDFKTPITTINLVKQNIMKKKESYDEDMLYNIDILGKECSALVIMIECINNLMRNDSYKVRTDKIVDLHEVLADCVSRMRFSIDSLGGKIIDEFNASSHCVRGNYYILLSVFINLITNAVKYNDNPPVIKIRTDNDDDKLIISVMDNGIGIKEEDLDKIFIKSYRAGGQSFGDGFGLGLFFVKDNIERLSGKMLVSSIYGSGSEFRISLPIV